MSDIIPKNIEEFTEEKIKELMSLESIESFNFDFKRNADSLEKDFCAFSNTLGGFIIIGIDEIKENKQTPFIVYGIEDFRKEESTIKNKATLVEPFPEYKTKLLKVESKDIIILEIKESESKPTITRSSQVFVRIGASSQPASREVIIRLFSDIIQERKFLSILDSELNKIKKECEKLDKELSFLSLAGGMGIHEVLTSFPTKINLTIIYTAYNNIQRFLERKDLLSAFLDLVRSIEELNSKIDYLMSLPYRDWPQSVNKLDLAVSPLQILEKIKKLSKSLFFQ